MDNYIRILRAEAASHRRPAEARADLQRLLFASTSDLLATAVAAVATVGDIASWDFGRAEEANIAFGKVFADPLAVARLDADAVADAIAEAVDHGGAEVTTMIRGLASALEETPQRLADVAVQTPEGFAQLVLARDLDAAIAGLRRSGAGTSEIVRALVATSLELRREQIETPESSGGFSTNSI